MDELLDHYRVHEVIGAGSFATVHRAHDVRLDAAVAVKVLAENHSLNPEIRERFIAEGRSLRRIGSRHLVAVHDIGETSRQQPYLVLELADRGTLRDRVEARWAQGWRASAEDVMAVARPLAAAVGAVHRARMVHRDLSPGNLLLTSGAGSGGGDDGPTPGAGPTGALLAADEQLLVADLGMCKDLAASSGLTVAAGTHGFRPPEQSRPSVVDIRADIWAMSALLRWLGRDAELPAALEEVLTRGMQEDPAARQTDAAAWLAEVEEALTPAPGPSAAPATTMPEGGAPPTAPAPARRVRRRALFVAALVLALLVGLGIGGVLGLGDGAPSAAGGASLAIGGPTEVRVGEEAVFTAEVEGAESWVWTLPSGSHLADAEQMVLTASGPGTAEVVLRARAPDGTELEARHSVRVRK